MEHICKLCKYFQPRRPHTADNPKRGNCSYSKVNSTFFGEPTINQRYNAMIQTFSDGPVPSQGDLFGYFLVREDFGCRFWTVMDLVNIQHFMGRINIELAREIT